MGLTNGTNAGFVITAPTADPAGTATTIDTRAHTTKDTSPATATKITEVGWWSDNATDYNENFQIGLYAADGAVVPGEAGTLLEVSRTNAKGTTAGWKTVAVDWTISPNTAYWLAVQVDDTIPGTNTDRTDSGGAGRDVLNGQTALPDPFGGGALADADAIIAIYAVWTAPELSVSLTETLNLTDVFTGIKVPGTYPISDLDVLTLTDAFSIRHFALPDYTLSALDVLSLTDTTSIIGISDTGWVIAGTGSDDATVGTTAWANPDRVTADDESTSDAAGGATTHYIKGSNFDFANSGLQTGHEILGIEVRHQRAMSTVAWSDDSIRLFDQTGSVAGDDKSAAATWAVGTPVNVDFGGQSDKWGLTPTANDILNANWGVGFSAISAMGFGSTDAIWMKIHYNSTPPIYPILGTDTLTLSDTISFGQIIYSMALNETLSLTDTLYKVGDLNVSLTDTLNLTDTATAFGYTPASFGKYLTEVLSLTDAIINIAKIIPVKKGSMLMFGGKYARSKMGRAF